MADLIFLTAGKIPDMIRRGEVSCRKVVEEHLAHIERHNYGDRDNPGLNAIVILDAERALQMADKIDAELSMRTGPDPRRLLGVPFTIKGFIDREGLANTAGCPKLRNNIAYRNAPSVQAFIDEGAIPLGMTNLSEFGATVDCINPLFGPTRNPCDPSRTPGGSSGGDAAAVAAGLVIFGWGASLAGSIEHPSSLCGVWGFKPTPGLISLSGIRDSYRPVIRPEEWNSLFSEWATPGPIARSAGDLLLLSEVSTGLSAPPAKELGAMKFLFSRTLGGFPVSGETERQFNDFIEKLRTADVGLKEVTTEEQIDTLDIKGAQEAAASLLVGYMSYSVDPFTLFVRKMLAYSPVPSGEGQAIMRGMLRGTARSRTTEGFESLMEKRQEFIGSLDSFLSGYDGWLMPAFPAQAFKLMKMMRNGALDNPFKDKIEYVDNDGVSRKVSLLVAVLAYNVLFNWSGNPIVSMPAMVASDGMPMGVKVVGGRREDMELLWACEEIEKVTGGFKRPPGY